MFPKSSQYVTSDAFFLCISSYSFLYYQVLRSSNCTPPLRVKQLFGGTVGCATLASHARSTNGLHVDTSLRGVLRAYASIGMALSSQLRFELPAGIRVIAEPRVLLRRQSLASAVESPLDLHPPTIHPAVRFRFFSASTGARHTHRRIRVERSRHRTVVHRVHLALFSLEDDAGSVAPLPAGDGDRRGVYRSGRTESVS